MLNAPAVQTAATLAASVEPISNATKQLRAQVDRAEIVDQKSLSKGGDLYKIVASQLLKSEDARKFLVGPLNDHVKAINDEFRPNTTALEKLKKDLKSKMDVFVTAEQKRLDEEAEAQRLAAEEEALQRASEAEAEGNTELADDIVDTAADAPDAKTKAPTARGDYGSSTSSRTDWKGECVSVKDLCAAIGRGDLPEDFITVNQARLNKFALEKKVEKTNFGIKLFKKISASVR